MKTSFLGTLNLLFSSTHDSTTLFQLRKKQLFKYMSGFGCCIDRECVFDDKSVLGPYIYFKTSELIVIILRGFR